MKAGFARLEITPPLGINLAGYFHLRPADGILTPLYVNALVLDDGENRAALLTLDLEGMTRENNVYLREQIAKATGIDPQAIFIHCTHTHQGPENGQYDDPEKRTPYDSYLIHRVCDSVVLAIEEMAGTGQAKLHIATGKAQGLSFIRLFKKKDGTFQVRPDPTDPEYAGPAGEPDEAVQLVRITREGAKDIAIAHFSTHPDVIGCKKICHDWPGYVREFMERSLCDVAEGKGVHALCMNGAQGDVNHINYLLPGKPVIGVEHAKHMARVITGEVMKLYTYARETDGSQLLFRQIPVRLKTNKASPKELEMSRKVKEIQDRGGYKAVAAAREAGLVDHDIYQATKNLLLESWPEEKDVFISALAVGEVVFVGFPGEPFTQVGRQTKAASPFAMTLPCCHGNGGEGYFPTQDVFTGGAYEANTSRFTVGAAEKLTEAAIELIRELFEQKPEAGAAKAGIVCG